MTAPLSRKTRIATAVLLALSIALAISGLAPWNSAEAQPSLSVSKSSGSVLLGGQASVRITVTNDGDARGYNLSVTDTFSSLPVGGKSISFVSASGPDGPLTPTSVVTDPVTGDLTVSIDDIKDLEDTESATITIVVAPDDPAWEVGDLLHDEVTASVNTQPDGSGATVEGTDTGDWEVTPIKMITKSAGQSTADEQATGCGELSAGDWPYTYTITVQNNYVNQTNSVVVTDALPDGVEFLTMVSGPWPDGTGPGTPPGHDPDTGITSTRWTIGDMAPGDTWSVTFQAGIRYDYFGTDNGGTNRPYDDYAWPDGLGAPVPNKAGFQNTAELDAEYEGDPYHDEDSASVTGAYATVEKGVVPGTAGNGETVTFTIRYHTSQYYNCDNLLVTDVLDDGLEYNGVSSPAPDVVQNDTPGTGQTTLIWNTLPAIGSGETGQIQFEAQVDLDWEDPPDPARSRIVAGDSLGNEVTFDADWHDEVDTGREGTTQSTSSASVYLGPKSSIIKRVAPDDGGSPGAYGDSIDASVGDTLWFKVQVNCDDSHYPLVNDVQYGNMDVVDWIPRGTGYVNGSASINYSDASDFNYDPPPGTFDARYGDQPETVTSGSLNGVAWSLGDADPGAWWEVEFRVVVQDLPVGADGTTAYDFGKLSGENSSGAQYSERDIADVNYTEPDLSIAKSHAALPAPFGAGSSVDYTVSLTNVGTAPAQNVVVVDTLPEGMRGTDPSGTVAVTLDTVTVDPADYSVSWDGSELTVDLGGGAVETSIPAGSVLEVTYTGTVDADVGAGATLTNEAVATWSSQPSTNPTRRDYGPVSDDDTVQLPELSIAKEILSAPPAPGDTVAIGENAHYRLTVTVPAGNLAYSPSVADRLQQDGMEYDGPTSLTDDGGSPDVRAVFSDGTTTMDPAEDYSTPNPGATFTWDMQTLAEDYIDNTNQAIDYEFYIDFQCKPTGLRVPVSEGGSATDPANWMWWPSTGGDPTADNLVPDSGRITWDPGDHWGTMNRSSSTLDTHVWQPYLDVTKANDSPPPATVAGGDTVNYTITVVNNGRTAAFDNLVVDTLADGMRGTAPTVTSVTLDGSPLTAGDDYSYAYVSGTGVQTFGFDGGTSETNIDAGSTLVIQYTGTVDGDIGSGAQLTNDVYAEYASLDEIPAGSRFVRENSDPAGSNIDDSTVQTRSATITKTIAGPNPAIIGETVTCTMDVTVPEQTVMYGPDILDVIEQNGIEYVTGTSSLADISGSPDTGASFSGSSDPDLDYDSPDPGATFTWHLEDIDNAGPGVTSDYVFRLQFDVKVTGLIDPAGSASDPDNWVWWWTHGGDPTINNTALDHGRVEWNDGSQDRGADSGDQTQNVHQPHLTMSKANDATGPVSAGSDIGYTLTIVNNGTSTAYDIIAGDTLDEGMRDTDPSGTVNVFKNGSATPIDPADYTVSWAGGELLVDMTDPVETTLDPGEYLEVTYTGTVDSDVGAGSTLRNVASVEYNSLDDGSGRHVERNSDASQPNTDDSSADVPDATITKSQDAPDDECSMGQPFKYTVSVNVPANTSVYETVVTDRVPDGLTVDGHATFVDGLPTPVGSIITAVRPDGATDISWQIGDYTNATAADRVLSLEISVHMDDTFNDGTPIDGLPPDQDVFQNTAFLTWYEAPGQNPHNDNDGADPVTATEPYLDTVKTNDATGPVDGGDVVGYTVTVTNNGTSTSYKNIVVDTIPEGMRGTSPSVTSVTLDGAPLSAPGDYTVSWDGGTGELTLDFDKGVSQTNIPEGQALVVNYDATVDDPAGSGGTLTNVASIGYNSYSDGSGRQTDRTGDPADHNTGDSSIDVQAASVAKAQDLPGSIATIGTECTYTISVAVPSYTTIFNAEVEDTFPDGLTVTGAATATGSIDYVENPVTGQTYVLWQIGDYTNSTGAPVVLTATVDVRVDDEYMGGAKVRQGDIFSNTADLTWYDAETGGTEHNESGDAGDIIVREPSLSVTKDVDEPSPEAGDTLTYTIEITNDGNWAAYDVTLDDTVDADLTYVPASITGPGADGSGAPDLAWDIGTLNPSDTATCTYQATVDGGIAQGAVVPNTGTVPSYSGLALPNPYARIYDPVQDSADVTVRAASLTLEKVVTANPNPAWYEETTYQITVTNDGNATAHDVGVSDTIPSPRFSYVNGSTTATWPGGTYLADPAGAPGPELSWPINAELDPTEQLVLTFDMLTEQWASHGTHTNSATGSGNDGAGAPLPGPSDTADIEVQQEFGITIEKAIDDFDGYVPIGEEFGYTVTITNVGNTTIPEVPLDDTYDDAFIEFVEADPAPDTTAPGNLSWSDVTGGLGLSPAGSVEVNLTFKGIQVGTAPDTNDTVSVSTTDDEGNPIEGTDVNESLTITDPSLHVTKELDEPDAKVPVGEEFGYTITIENTGDTAILAPVIMQDAFNPEYISFKRASVTPDIADPGDLFWLDASGGAGIAVGEKLEIEVVFTAEKPGKKPNTNNMVYVLAFDEHDDPMAGQGVNKNLIVTNPKMSVAKALAPWQPKEIKVGDRVAFAIEVTNTGDTFIEPPIELRDEYNKAYWGYRDAAPKPDDDKDDGAIIWSDVSDGEGLKVGDSTIAYIEFEALQEGNSPETDNLAVLTGATDADGNPVAGSSGDLSTAIGQAKNLGSKGWFLAEGSTGGGFDTWILVQNPNSESEANVELVFTTHDGPREPLPLVMEPESRATVRINDYVPDDFHVSTMVSADVPVVAERSMYWNKGYLGETDVPGTPEPYEMKGGHANGGVPREMLPGFSASGKDGEKSHYFPEGATAAGFDTWILLVNPNQVDADAKAILMDEEGIAAEKEVIVPAQSRGTIHLDDFLPDAQGVATHVVSDQPLVAERSMYWDPEEKGLEPYQMRGGHSNAGSPAPGKTWFLAEGSTGEGFETYILLQNPNDAEAPVQVTFMNAEGVASEAQLTMPPTSRATLKVSDYVPNDFHVSTYVTSNSEIVAERSMYWDKRVSDNAYDMRDGHSNVGTGITGKIWMVPEGSTGVGFDTFVLVSNTEDAAADCEVTFMTHEGPRPPVKINIQPRARYTIRLSDYVPNDFHVSTLLEADGEIVVERAMYWDRRQSYFMHGMEIRPYEMMGGHSAGGVDP